MLKRILVPIFATLFFAGLFGTIAGCNTIEGIGQDIRNGGRLISNDTREQRSERDDR